MVTILFIETGKPIMIQKTAVAGDKAAARVVDRIIRDKRVRADNIASSIFDSVVGLYLYKA